MKDKWTRYEYRKGRSRRKIAEKANGRPRLTVTRSLKYIYAQIIDDAQGKTLASASSLSKEIKAPKAVSAKNVESAKKVGELLAKKAIAAGVKQVAFDRGAHIYHGRVKALADAARAGGLDF
jgi:large subunit ribosomal protein L18